MSGSDKKTLDWFPIPFGDFTGSRSPSVTLTTVRGVWPPRCPPAQDRRTGPTFSSVSIPQARRMRARTVDRNRVRRLQAPFPDRSPPLSPFERRPRTGAHASRRGACPERLPALSLARGRPAVSPPALPALGFPGVRCSVSLCRASAAAVAAAAAALRPQPSALGAPRPWSAAPLTIVAPAQA